MVEIVNTQRVVLVLMLAHAMLCVVLALIVTWVLYDDAQTLACCAKDHMHLLIVITCLIVVAIAEGWSTFSRMRSPVGAASRSRLPGWITLVGCLVLIAAAVLGNLSVLFLFVGLVAIVFAVADRRFFPQAAS